MAAAKTKIKIEVFICARLLVEICVPGDIPLLRTDAAPSINPSHFLIAFQEKSENTYASNCFRFPHFFATSGGAFTVHSQDMRKAIESDRLPILHNPDN